MPSYQVALEESNNWPRPVEVAAECRAAVREIVASWGDPTDDACTDDAPCGHVDCPRCDEFGEVSERFAAGEDDE